MAKKINSSSKKDDIYQAYKALLDTVESSVPEQLPLEKEKETKKQNQLQKVEKLTLSSLDQGISSFIESFTNNNKSLAEKIFSEFATLKNTLLHEKQKLEDIQSAIALESQNLEEVFGIKKEAIRLSDLLRLQADQRNEWEEGQVMQKEQQKREESEYLYTRDKKRREEEDAYNQEQRKKKMIFDDSISEQKREIDEKEKILNSQIQELEELKTLRDSFDTTVSLEIEKSLKIQKQELQKEFEMEKRLTDQEYRSRGDLQKSQIESLQLQITQQNDLIQRLRKEADTAREKSQELALMTIETQKKTGGYFREKQSEDLAF